MKKSKSNSAWLYSLLISSNSWQDPTLVLYLYLRYLAILSLSQLCLFANRTFILLYGYFILPNPQISDFPFLSSTAFVSNVEYRKKRALQRFATQILNIASTGLRILFALFRESWRHSSWSRERWTSSNTSPSPYSLLAHNCTKVCLSKS
jgi:hypothetical protein